MLAWSRSASSSTTYALLPPSSSETRLKSRAAWIAISRPTADEPVKWIMSTPG